MSKKIKFPTFNKLGNFIYGFTMLVVKMNRICYNYITNR